MAESRSSSNTPLAAAGIGKSELARRIGKDEKEVRRILDPKHPTKLPGLTAALGRSGSGWWRERWRRQTRFMP